MAKIRVELEVGSEFCGNCPMFKLFPHRDREAVCCLYNIPLTFSPRYLGYVRCDECKQAEVKDESLGMAGK